MTCKRPTLQVFIVYMAGQCLALHTLVMVEGIRKGNRRRVVSLGVEASVDYRGEWSFGADHLCSFSIWGLVYQSIPWGVIKPLYWALSLGTSPVSQVDASSLMSAAQIVEILT